MLHSIPEICELTQKERSTIYAMLNNGEMSYVIGQDGKRKVDTSELKRVFPKLSVAAALGEIEVEDSKQDKKSIAFSQEKEAKLDRQHTQSQELYELRGMITDLRNEIDNVLGDNRRLLRLLEHQTMRAEPVSEPVSEPERLASTEMAKKGWKEYQKTRQHEETEGHAGKVQPEQEDEPNTETKSPVAIQQKKTSTSPSKEQTITTEVHWLDTLKNFFLKY